MKQLQQGKKKLQKGFTLIELMIVVAIIGVLSAIAIPAYQNYVKKSEAATGLATAKALVTNVDMYIQEEGSFPTTNDLDKLGAKTDMNALGSLTLVAGTAATSSASGSLGSIQFEFDGNSTIDKAQINLTRSNDGWACDFDPKTATIDPTEIPKTCP